MITVAPSTVADVTNSPNFPALAAAYAAESQIKGLPAATTDMRGYQNLETAGFLHVFAAHRNGELIGFLSLLVAPHPRYSVSLATTESYFVAREHRNTGAGLRLLSAAKVKARELGAPGLLVSAPSNGSLAEVLPRLGFVETNRVFFQCLA